MLPKILKTPGKHFYRFKVHLYLANRKGQPKGNICKIPFKHFPWGCIPAKDRVLFPLCFFYWIAE